MKYLKEYKRLFEDIDWEDWDYEEEEKKSFFIVQSAWKFYIVSPIDNTFVEMYMNGKSEDMDIFYPLNNCDIDRIIKGKRFIRVRDISIDGYEFTNYKLKDLPLDLKDLMYYNQEKKIVPLPL